MSIKLNSVGGGSVTFQEPNTASDFTLSVPSRTGNVAVDGPAFSAYLSGNQTVTGGVLTKIQCNGEEFDTNSCYDNSTNYRFTPTVAGYYQISSTMGPYGNAVPTRSILALYKNGSYYKRFSDLAINSTYANGLGGSALVYFNGSTDYVEIYAQINISSGTAQIEGGSLYATTFMGVFVRAA